VVHQFLYQVWVLRLFGEHCAEGVAAAMEREREVKFQEHTNNFETAVDVLVGKRRENGVAVFACVLVYDGDRLTAKKDVQRYVLFEFFCFQLPDIEIYALAGAHDVGLTEAYHIRKTQPCIARKQKHLLYRDNVVRHFQCLQLSELLPLQCPAR